MACASPSWLLRRHSDAPNEAYYPIGSPEFDEFAQFEGLGTGGSIQTDSNGAATFTIRSKGLLAANQFLPIEFAVREGSPFVGQPETVERAMLVDHNWYTRTIDFGYSFIGGDPEGVTGIGGAMAGGLLVVGDVGSLVKNGWRAAGKSDKQVSKAEVALAGLGIATTASAAFAGGVDGPVAAIKSLIAATDGVKLGKILGTFLARGVSNTAELAQLGKFALAMMKSDVALQGAKQILTSEALVEASIRTVDKLGDLGRTFLERTARIGASYGIRAAQDVTALFGKISDDALNFFKQLPAAQLDTVMDHMAVILRGGKIDVSQLSRLLGNNRLYTAAYDRSRILEDLRLLADSEGFGKLVNVLGAAAQDSWAKGRAYELQTAAGIVRNASGDTKITFLTKYAKEIDPDTGKLLDFTDVDFIVEDGTNLIYYQAKSTPGAFKSVEETERWVRIVKDDAMRNGVTNQVIRYVTPDKESVAEEITQFLENQFIEIVESPLLR